jgi:membrane protein
VKSAPAATEAALTRLPPRLRRAVAWLLSSWPGRILLNSGATFGRIGLFDRAMTIAGQIFTSVFPILITLGTLAQGVGSARLADEIDMPDQSRDVLNEALDDAGTATVGVVGVLIVWLSATSLSRALMRAYAAIWDLQQPRRSLASAWRWLAVPMGFAVSLVAVRALAAFTDDLPAPNLWQVATAFVGDLAIAVLVPWVLLSGAVSPRRLAPGAVVFAVVMLAVRPASHVWLPRELEASQEQYGSIGVAFTYLAFLYLVSLCFLAASAVGQVIATDRGSLGAGIRGRDTKVSS